MSAPAYLKPCAYPVQPPVFEGPGHDGLVPDPGIEQGFVLSDSGLWVPQTPYPPTYDGAGADGLVPDAGVEQGFVLSDSGLWVPQTPYPPTYDGAGADGLVPDAEVEDDLALSDRGEWVLPGGGGGLRLLAPGVAVPNIDGGWRDIDAWDEVALQTPRYVTQDIVNDAIIFERAMTYRLDLTLVLTFNEMNQGRFIGVRLWDVPDQSGSPPLISAVGRNTGGTNFVISGLPVEILPEDVGQAYKLQIGGGDTFTGVTMYNGAWTVWPQFTR